MHASRGIFGQSAVVGRPSLISHRLLNRIAPAIFTDRTVLPESIPGPPPGCWLSTAEAMLPWAKDSLGHATKLFAEYGDLLALVKGGGTRHIASRSDCPGTILCYGAAYNQAITSAHETCQKENLGGSLYPGENPTERFKPLQSFGAGLFAVNGDEHRIHRRLLGPVFSRKRLAGYCAEMVKQTHLEFNAWKIGEERDVAKDFRRLAAHIVSATLFGSGANQEASAAGEDLKTALSYLGTPATKLFAWDLPGMPFKHYVDAATSLQERMLRIIERRRNSGSDGDDMLDALIHAQDEESQSRLSELEILGHVSVFFAAGHETSANALAWTALLLATHPEVARKLQTEIDEVLGDEDPTPDNLDKLEYLGWVIKESLRIFPPAPWNGRVLTEALTLGDHTIPAGSEILFSIYNTHRDETIFPEPLRFKPERWDNFKPSVYEYTPFSSGPRTCIGAMFATMEIKIIIAMMLQRFRLGLVPQRIDRFAEMTLSPKHGLKAQIFPADGAFERSSAELSGDFHEMVTL